jgi:mRNA interferase MazF
MSDNDIRRGEMWWVGLDPTQGSEIRKTRPCLVLTSNTLNRLRKTVVVVPLSTAAHAHPPVTVPVHCQGRPAVAIIDQIRAVGKHRLKSRIEIASDRDVNAVTRALSEILEF